MTVFNFTCNIDRVVNYNNKEFLQFLNDNFTNFKTRLYYLKKVRENRTIEKSDDGTLFKSFVEIHYPSYTLKIYIQDTIKEGK